MNKAFRLLAVSFFLVMLAFNTTSIKAHPLMAIITSLLSPTSCPVGGCAAGQRLNTRAEYPVNPLYTAGPNTQVCVYTTQEGGQNWADATVFRITNSAIYTNGELDSICSTNLPSGSAYLGGANATFLSSPNQQFDFAFRISKQSTTAGALKISIYQRNLAGDAWDPTDGPTDLNLTVTSVSGFSYVASSAANCGIYYPCYLNSGDDLAGGIGTGLKDAVDAGPVNGTITILGTYLIKSNTIILNNPQTLRGINDSSLTYTGTSCNNAMLQLTNGGTLQNLNINDGSCASPSRDLVSINSASLVKLENNEVINGRNAVSILDNTGNVSIRFNHINGNSDYGILRAAGSGTGTVRAVANNIYGNRAGAQVECNNKGTMDHNFWGTGVLETEAISNCTHTDGGRLGVMILRNSMAPGVTAQELPPLTATKTGYFSGQISVDGTDGTKIIVVNHGSGTSGNIPFFPSGIDNLTSCSNFWDVFISDENSVAPTELNLYVKYYSGCASKIESSILCGGPDQTFYPLLWYDPINSVTDLYDTTGQIPAGSGASSMAGQTTSCDMINDEVEVSIDAESLHRPNLISDLKYTPFFIGYELYSPNITSFTAVPGVSEIDLEWETSSEYQVKGYHVIRALNESGPYYRTSDLIPAKGNKDIGGIYKYIDTGLNNGTTYWYKVEIIDINNISLGFNSPISSTTYSMIPIATVITPDSVEVYGLSLAVTVKGNNFMPSSKVVWDNNMAIDMTTSYIDSTQLTAVIPGSLYSDPNSSDRHEITVYNPGPGGGFSPPLTFTIKNPVPTLESITPDYSDGNVTTISIAVKGDYFVYDSAVRLNGSSSNITTTFVDRYNLTASIPRSKLSSGAITVTVYNPLYGGGITSSSKTFNLYTPTPTQTGTATKTRTIVPSKPPATKIPPTRTRTSIARTTTKTVTTTPSVTQTTKPSITATGSVAPGTVTPGTIIPEPSTPTPSLAPGEPTYTPVPPTPEVEDTGSSEWTWPLLSVLRVLAGSLLGIGALSLPAFLIFHWKTRNKPQR
jgi:hypothetical protein